MVGRELEGQLFKKRLVLIQAGLRKAGKSIGCIDDRGYFPFEAETPDSIATYEEKGPQLLGGSLALLPVLAETALEARESLDIDEFIEIIFNVHEKLDMEVTVHMHDNHGEWDAGKILGLIKEIKSGDKKAKIPGCGFAGLLIGKENLLGLSKKVSKFFQKNSNLVERMVKRGAKVIVLTGDHANKEAGKAFAVRNSEREKTVDTHKAIDQGTQTYNHDDWFFDDVIRVCGDVLKDKDKEEWANKVEDRSKRLNNDWLDKTTNILAGMHGVEVK